MPTQSSYSPWATLVFISLGMMITGLLWMSMPPMVLPISRQMSMSGAQVAIWVSTPLWIFVFFSLPMGMVADRWNLKYISGIGLFFIAIFATARSFAGSYASLMVVTILFSMGYTIYFPCVPKIVSKIFTTRKMATASGIYLPDSAGEKPQKGKVLAIGADEITDSGAKKKSPVKVGDVVIYKKWGGSEVKIGGKEYLFSKFEDILAVETN